MNNMVAQTKLFKVVLFKFCSKLTLLSKILLFNQVRRNKEGHFTLTEIVKLLSVLQLSEIIELFNLEGQYLLQVMTRYCVKAAILKVIKLAFTLAMTYTSQVIFR